MIDRSFLRGYNRKKGRRNKDWRKNLKLHIMEYGYWMKKKILKLNVMLWIMGKEFFR